MRNGYFQLVCGGNGTALKIVLPKDGGSNVNVKEVMEYLNLYGIMYDTPLLNKGISDAQAASTGEYFFQINQNPSMEVRENYQINVSPDKMTATARFYPPSIYGARIIPEEFFRDLALKKLTFGTKNKEIMEFLMNPAYCTDIVIAQGQAPRHGTDARIEYYFDTDLVAKPTLNEDGSVDFFHLNTVSHCHKGDILARLYPEDPGEYGVNVFNEKVKPRDVKRTSLKFGRNIALSEDRQVLTAEVDGHVTLVEGKVFVSDVLEVENVDNSTGNIDYEGSVKINGNVGVNFVVKAKGNIEVKGVVEGAVLEAGGDIIIARGMNGMAKGTLNAGGNIISKFIENAKATAKGYVSSESIVHSEVMAGTEITVSGKHGYITGGRVSAGKLIQVKTLGSSMGADTIVEVGVDPSIKIRIQQLQKKMRENEKNIEGIHPVLSSLTQKISKGVKLRPDQMKNFQDMLQREKLLKEERDKDMEELSSLQEMMEQCVTASVEVTGEVFAGTRICIADVSMVVKNGMKYCKFVKSQGDVQMKML